MSAPSFRLPSPKRSATGLVVSVLVHLLIIVLVVGGLLGGREALRVLGTGIGPGPAGGGGGGGGSRVSYIELPSVGASAARDAAPVPEEKTPPPPPPEQVAKPAPTPPPVTPPATEVASAAQAGISPSGEGTGTGAGVGPGSGGGTGGGSGGGTGPGVGSGAGPGTGGDSLGVTPPSLRYWVPPTEKAPKELRDTTLQITFWVKADGTVDHFETDPEIDDRKYREKFAELVMKTRFRPARTRAGVAVPAVMTMQYTLSTE